MPRDQVVIQNNAVIANLLTCIERQQSDLSPLLVALAAVGNPRGRAS